jgi:hypothetical protein
MRKYLEEDISLESNKRIVLSIKTFNLFSIRSIIFNFNKVSTMEIMSMKLE